MIAAMLDITDAEPRLRQMNDALAEIERLREAIRRLAEQNATLSVCDGNVTVTMDATLTEAEREAIEWARCMAKMHSLENAANTLHGLLERL